MNRDDIIRLAREAGLSNDFGKLGYPYLPELERFANLVAAAEREACAEVCELMYDYGWLDAKRCAREIRARGQV
jgi:hypothetical protein